MMSLSAIVFSSCRCQMVYHRLVRGYIIVLLEGISSSCSSVYYRLVLYVVLSDYSLQRYNFFHTPANFTGNTTGDAFAPPAATTPLSPPISGLSPYHYGRYTVDTRLIHGRYSVYSPGSIPGIYGFYNTSNAC